MGLGLWVGSVLWNSNMGLCSPNTNFVRAAGVQGVMWGAFAETVVLGRCQFSEFNKPLGAELLSFGQGSVMVSPAEA